MYIYIYIVYRGIYIYIYIKGRALEATLGGFFFLLSQSVLLKAAALTEAICNGQL